MTTLCMKPARRPDGRGRFGPLLGRAEAGAVARLSERERSQGWRSRAPAQNALGRLAAAALALVRAALGRPAAVALALMCAVLGAAAVRAETLALAGGTVHTVSGPTLASATVVITDGKIAAVGENLSPPAGARVVSCAGKHVYPGLVSANTVLGLTEIGSVRGTNDFSETGDVNPDVRAEVQINPESELLPVARANGITSAVVVPRGGPVAGTAALIHLDGWTYEDMTVKAPAGLFVQWPSLTNTRGFFAQGSDEEQKKARERAIEVIRTTFDDARAYWKARGAEGKAGIPRHDRDVKWDAMGRALRGEIPVMFQASSLAQIHAVLKFVDEQKLPRVILVGASDAWRVAAELKARGIAVIAGPTLALPDRRYEPYDQGFTLPGRLAEAGVPFCVSDGGSPFTAMNARNLAYHAAMASAFGLSREDALKSVTLYPAQLFGVADRIGSIEPGKAADLVVADGDPLEVTTHVEQVYIAGRPVSMETRQTRLFQKYDARPRGGGGSKR